MTHGLFAHTHLFSIEKI